MATKLQKVPLFSQNHKQLRVVIAGVLVVLFVVGLGTMFAFWDKTLPNVYLADQAVSHKTAAELSNIIKQRTASSQVTISDGKTTVKPSLKELGVKVETEKTVDELLSQHRENIWSHLALWQPRHVNLAVSVDEEQMSAYLTKKLKVATTPPQNAKVVFSQKAGKFTIQPDKAGSAIDTDKLGQAIISTVAQGEKTTLPISHRQASASIEADKLDQPLAAAQAYLSTPVSLSAASTRYQPSAAQKASWVTFTAKNNTYKVGINKEKVKQYVTSVIAPLNVPTKNQDVIKGVNGSADIVVQAGQNGQSVTNQNQIISGLLDAVSRKQAYTGVIQIKTTPYKTTNMTAEKKWIEVNLSTQSLTAYERATPVRNFLISSGTPGHETVTGVFHIYIKYASQRMTGGSRASGDYYDLPNVQWVNYFYQDYALHGAYWHHNWGHPMSHGCVNEPNDQAKWIYDWAPIGTTVVVHY